MLIEIEKEVLDSVKQRFIDFALVAFGAWNQHESNAKTVFLLISDTLEYMQHKLNNEKTPQTTNHEPKQKEVICHLVLNFCCRESKGEPASTS